MEKSTNIVEGFKIPLSEFDRISKVEISKSIEGNYTINQQKVMEMYNLHHPTAAEFT